MINVNQDTYKLLEALWVTKHIDPEFISDLLVTPGQVVQLEVSIRGREVKRGKNKSYENKCVVSESKIIPIVLNSLKDGEFKSAKNLLADLKSVDSEITTNGLHYSIYRLGDKIEHMSKGNVKYYKLIQG